MKTLSKKQLATLGAVSHRAYKRLRGTGLPLGDYATWRHEFTALHCGGRTSWRTLYQTDYTALRNAFAAVYGGTQKVDNTPKSDADALIYTIRNTVNHWDIPAAYVAKVIAGKASRPWVTPEMSLDAMLAGVPEKTLRHILITLENRFRKKYKQESEAMGIDAPARVHVLRSTVPPARVAAYKGDIIAAPTPQKKYSARFAALIPSISPFTSAAFRGAFFCPPPARFSSPIRHSALFLPGDSAPISPRPPVPVIPPFSTPFPPSSPLLTPPAGNQ